MTLMSFKTWLEGIEAYEPFRPSIEEKIAKRKFVFDKWWPEGTDRVYLPLGSEQSVTSTFKHNIQQAMEEFKGLPEEGLPAAPGYELVDYQKGLAKPKGGKNLYKVIRILNASEKNAFRELEARKAAKEISPEKYEETKKTLKDGYEWHRENFINDPARSAGTSPLQVVISKNPHDLASMSTGRGWTSCMELGVGAHHDSIYCEVKNGGFVAYLINKDDPEIKRPIARLHIRRFKNSKNKNVAVPEDSAYGTANPAFVPTVQNWLQEKQGHIEAGQYKMMGGKYSDTFKDKLTTLVPAVSDPKYYEKLFKDLITIGDKIKYDENKRNLAEAGYKSLIKNSDSTKISADVALDFMKLAFPDFFGGVKPITSLLGAVQLCEYIKAFPHIVTKEMIDKIFDYYKVGTPEEKGIFRFHNLCNGILLSKFKQFLSDEQKSKLEIRYGRVQDKKQAAEFAPHVIDNLNNLLSMDNFAVENLRQYNQPTYDVKDMIANIFDIAAAAGRASPETIRTALNFKNKLPEIAKNIIAAQQEKYKQAKEKKGETYTPMTADQKEVHSKHLVSDLEDAVLHFLMMTKSDTPEVIDFIGELLSNATAHGGLTGRRLNTPISGLGNVGRPLLPWLNKLIGVYEEMKSNPPKTAMWSSPSQLDANIEAVKYLIDSIETGRPSKKFSERPQNYNHDFEKVALERMRE
jgi:hypothetical protein